MESPNARALRMGQILADFYTDNPSQKGEQYLSEWKVARPELLCAVSAEDGRTVEMRHAVQAFKQQKQELEAELMGRDSVTGFRVVGIVRNIEEGGNHVEG